MTDDTEQKAPRGRLLTTLGYVAFFIVIFGRNIIGDAAGLFLLPALVLMFIGRATTRRERRRPKPEAGRTSGSAASRQAPRPAPAQPTPKPKRRPSIPSPDPAKVEADLEKTLASLRTEPEPEVEVSAVADTEESRDFQPKTSAEMIEEARKRFNKPG